MPSTQVTYRYAATSTLRGEDGQVSVGLASTGTGTFLDAYVERADVVAAGLLLVGRVASTRFHDPTTATRLAELADPIITTGDGTVRFESLSACCGVAARLDLPADGVEVTTQTPGTTNVDLGPEMRRLLGGVLPHDPMRVRVADTGLEVTTLDGSAHERTVALPDRWVRSLADLQVLASRMSLRATLDQRQVRAFLRSLPPTTPPRSTFWAQPVGGGGLRLASRPVAGGVPLGGPERLRVLDAVLRHCREVRVYAADGDGPGASWWEVALPHARLGLGLSPETSRGFSGEGALLDGDDDPTADAALAVSGRLGYDLAEGRFFPRLLPVGRDLLGTHPRLATATALVADGAVRPEGDHHVVRGRTRDYVVRLGAPADRCSCRWYVDHGGTRGPCAHVLAVRLLRDGAPPTGKETR